MSGWNLHLSSDENSKPLLETPSDSPSNLRQYSLCFLSHMSLSGTVCSPLPPHAENEAVSMISTVVDKWSTANNRPPPQKKIGKCNNLYGTGNPWLSVTRLKYWLIAILALELWKLQLIRKVLCVHVLLSNFDDWCHISLWDWKLWCAFNCRLNFLKHFYTDKLSFNE